MITRRKVMFAAAWAAMAANPAGAQETQPTDAPDGAWTLKPFMLEDVNGTIVDAETLQGRYALVFFGYTSCPDVCPTTLMTIANALKAMKAGDADQLLPLFVSLDPARDSRKVLSAYTAAFDSRIVALRGPKPYVDAIAANFGVSYRIVIPDANQPAQYAIDHTAVIAFLAPDGSLIRKFPSSIAPGALAEEIGKAMAAGPAGN